MSVPGLARRLWIWGPVAAYLSLIFYLSAQSRADWAASYPDYVLHGLEYLGLSVLVARGLNDGLLRPVPEWLLAAAWMLCVLYAISDEIHQLFVPGRSGDYRDALADAAGAALGLLLVQAWGRVILSMRTT